MTEEPEARSGLQRRQCAVRESVQTGHQPMRGASEAGKARLKLGWFAAALAAGFKNAVDHSCLCHRPARSGSAANRLPHASKSSLHHSLHVDKLAT